MSRYLLSVAAAMLTALAAGCGANETTGSPTTAAPPPDPFDVCEDLPPSALEAAGLDPSTKDVVTNAPTGPTSWIVCAWDPADIPSVNYVVELYSTSHTMKETRDRTDLTDFHETDIGGREGVTFREKRTAETRCRAAFAAEQGSFILSTAWLETGEKPDLCGLAVKYMTALEPQLPG